MPYTLPFTSFQVGYKRYRVVLCETDEEYLEQHRRREIEITDTTHEEKGCTEQCSGLILLNGEEHHGDQGLLLHTLFHEIGHVLM